ncbi:MAG TPA: SusD/RagB family nutrient-binding outer membrane lipoprotein, partial [Flavobacteriaceae bacterium]|nr:SusD/RagB family nutrient-binding outer membrane lipoprotein [Flavobacteriaceae bacterium]
HLGVPQGILNYPPSGTYLPANVSNLGPGLLVSSEQDAPLMLLAESLFLQAEAVQRGFLAGSAQAMYEAGITASFDYLGATGASTYYSQSIPNVGWAASPDKIEAIITQKWIALNGINGFESWVEYNRTGYPTGLPVPLNNSHADRPVRLAYPSSEITGNSANIPSQPDVFSQPIFWAN